MLHLFLLIRLFQARDPFRWTPSDQLMCLHEGSSVRLKHWSIIDGLFSEAFKRSKSKSNVYYREQWSFVSPKDIDLSGNELTHLNKTRRNKNHWLTSMTAWKNGVSFWPSYGNYSEVRGADRRWSQCYCSVQKLCSSKCCERQWLTVQKLRLI